MSALVNQEHEIFKLPDGRHLGYAKYGDPDGRPVLFFHGIPGSRLQRHPDLQMFQDLSICVYALDRPGTGLSSRQPRRTLLDWAEDVRAFCDGMGIGRFACLGISAGGPYALACAYRLPERVSCAALVSSLPPLQRSELFAMQAPKMRLMFRLAERAPVLMQAAAALLYRRYRRHFRQAFEKLAAELPESDKKLLDQPEIAAMFINDVGQAFRQGGRGVVMDMNVLCKPWGFSPAEVIVPIHIWHGTSDTVAPYQAVHAFAEFPNGQTHWIDGAGHFMALQYGKEIFGTLIF